MEVCAKINAFYCSQLIFARARDNGVLLRSNRMPATAAPHVMKCELISGNVYIDMYTHDCLHTRGRQAVSLQLGLQRAHGSLVSQYVCVWHTHAPLVQCPATHHHT